ncbi:MAG: N-acetyltransferase [Candidatus Latescibacterota bacterium]
MRIRAEEEEDWAAVYALHVSAFETECEADLVEVLRQQVKPIVSLVAEVGGAVVGHIMFSAVEVPPYPSLTAMGLGPMAVAPAHQNKGSGSALVWAGLDQCRKKGVAAVFVLGHPEYYPRFGFVPSSHFDIACEYEVPEEVFMALELKSGALRGKRGTVIYHAAFDNA